MASNVEIDERQLLATVFGAITEVMGGKKDGPAEKAIASRGKSMHSAQRAAGGGSLATDEELANIFEQVFRPMLGELDKAMNSKSNPK